MYIDCKKLKSEMGRAGMTMVQLAKASGIPRITLAHYGNGYRNVPAASVQKLCDALGISDIAILVDRVELIGRCAEIRKKMNQAKVDNLDFEQKAYQEEIDRLETVIRKLV